MPSTKGVKFRFCSLAASAMLLLFPVFSQAQQKPAKQAAPPAKPAPAAKPAAPAARPASNARPGTASTTRPATTPGSRPGTSPGAKPGTAAGAKPGTTTAAKNNATAGAKPGTASSAAKVGAPAAKSGTTAGAKTVGTAPASKSPAVPKGGTSKVTAKGNTHVFNAGGKKVGVTTKSGTTAKLDRSGRVSTIHTKSGMTINHGAHGERRFETRRPGGGRVVGYGHGRGFAERGYYRGGRPYMRRSYYYGGRSYAYAYRGYYYHGAAYYGYVPPVYYGPAYYGWAYNPWPAPVAYGWGWGGAPWYGAYGYYFAPAPVYPYPSLWLTDYLLAANLQAAYEAQAAANAENIPADGGFHQPAYGGGDEAPAVMSAALKEEIAAEVKAEIAAEKEAAAHPDPAGAVSSTPPAGGQTGPEETPAALDPAHRIFIVSQVISSSNEDGTDCSLSPGDVLKRVDDTPDADSNVKVLVASSQKNDCGVGSQVPVSLQDLQDMHNDFAAKIGEGLGKLAENQGKNGIPAGPPAASKANPAGQAQPDLTVQSDLKAQQDEAGQAEKEVQDAASDGGA